MSLRLSEAQTYVNFDEDLGEEVAGVKETPGELREAWKTLFPSHPQSPLPRPFALTYHDLTLSNILVDSAVV